jgi:hypothetical protein
VTFVQLGERLPVAAGRAPRELSFPLIYLSIGREARGVGAIDDGGEDARRTRERPGSKEIRGAAPLKCEG